MRDSATSHEFFFSIDVAVVVCFLLPLACTCPPAPVEDTFVCSWCNTQCTRMEEFVDCVCSIEIKNLERSLSVGTSWPTHINVSLLLLPKDSIPTYFHGSYLSSL